MKLVLSYLLLALTATSVFSQYNWDKGYFINNKGERTECLIRRLDGAYNPKKIEYKLNETSNPVVLGILDVSEFGIIGEERFIRATVNIDRSSSDLNKASASRNPDWSNETLFLKPLITGEANLYVYKEDGLTRFFFNNRSSEIEQLVYKAYFPYPNQVAYNKSYLEQLQRTLSCDKMPQKIDVPYQAKPLENLFKRYNECMGVVPTEAGDAKKAPVTANINLRPGINYSTLAVTAKVGAGQRFTGNFRSKPTFRAGVELEIFPSFNNRNKRWSILFEPNYRNYQDEFTENDRTYTAKYSSIEIPLGLRRYFYLANNKAIFLNINIVYDYPSNKSGGQIPSNFITNAVFDYQIVNSGAVYAAGLGFSAKRIFGEVRLYSNRNPTRGSTTFDSDFANAALVLGYRLLK